MKTAVILAAGIGSRLAPLTNEFPKSCLKVGRQSLISRVVGQLLNNNSAMKVYVATGHCEDEIESELSIYGNNIHFVYNSAYRETNNMESCRLVLDERKESCGSLIINADCIYEDEIIESMVNIDHSAIACDIEVFTEENMKVSHQVGIAKDISKQLRSGPDVATSIDIYSFIENDLGQLHKIMGRYHMADDLNQWTEVAIKELIGLTDVRILDCAGSKWMEIDDHRDLAFARELFNEY